MGNSPVDKSKDFIKSGMTLISEPASDRWLRKVDNHKNLDDKDNRGGITDYK